MPKTLIVPVDGSKPADHAFRCAQRLAAHLDPCDIVVMTASTYPEDRRRAHLDALVGDATKTRIRAELVAGESADAIVRLTAESADPVVCMTTRGRGHLTAPVLGSVATDVVRRVEAPVLLVGPQCEKDWWHHPAKLVVCWADEDSSEILAPAQAWSDTLGMELWLETVLQAEHPRRPRSANTLFPRSRSSARIPGDIPTRRAPSAEPGPGDRPQRTGDSGHAPRHDDPHQHVGLNSPRSGASRQMSSATARAPSSSSTGRDGNRPALAQERRQPAPERIQCP